MDLAGRLSNPPEAVETLPDQGWSDFAAPPGPCVQASGVPISAASAGRSEQAGRLSNPVQRRLSDVEHADLVRRYHEGASIDGLARELGIHRTTVINHLDRAGVARRRVPRKMTDGSVAQAAAQYQDGASLAAVADAFGVHIRTLRKDLRRAGTAIRPRRGSA